METFAKAGEGYEVGGVEFECVFGDEDFELCGVGHDVIAVVAYVGADSRMLIVGKD